MGERGNLSALMKARGEGLETGSIWMYGTWSPNEVVISRTEKTSHGSSMRKDAAY